MMRYYSKEELADLQERHNFARGRCPICHRICYGDGALECSSCGWTEEEPDQSTDPEEKQ